MDEDFLKKLTTPEAVNQMTLLNGRFQYLVGLRNSNTRTYLTVLGAMGAFFVYSLTKESTLTLEHIPPVLLLASLAMLILGYYALAYDAKMRARANIVAKEIEKIAIEKHLIFKPNANPNDVSNPKNEKLGEDYWYFGQVIAAISFSVVVFLNSGIVYINFLFSGSVMCICNLTFMLIDIFLFALAVYLISQLWWKEVETHNLKVKNWTPD